MQYQSTSEQWQGVNNNLGKPFKYLVLLHLLATVLSQQQLLLLLPSLLDYCTQHKEQQADLMTEDMRVQQDGSIGGSCEVGVACCRQDWCLQGWDLLGKMTPT